MHVKFVIIRAAKKIYLKISNILGYLFIEKNRINYLNKYEGSRTKKCYVKKHYDTNWVRIGLCNKVAICDLQHFFLLMFSYLIFKYIQQPWLYNSLFFNQKYFKI